MIYRDKSVGNLIRISVAKLILLKEGGIIWLKKWICSKNFLFCASFLIEMAENPNIHPWFQDYESFSPPGSRQSISASDMLKSFCKWQSQLTSDREYYDVALLLTRYGLISNVLPCATTYFP